MARMADVKNLPTRASTPRRPIKKKSTNKVVKVTKTNKLAILNTFLIFGIYLILLQDLWLPLLLNLID